MAILNRLERKMAVSAKISRKTCSKCSKRSAIYSDEHFTCKDCRYCIDINYFSSWNKIMRRTETVMKAVNIFRKRLVTNSYEDARHHLLRQSQHKTFSESITILERENELDKKDKLLQFTPFLGKDSLIRARGRLRHAQIPYSQKQPVILDSKNNINKLIIEKAHYDCRHLGTGCTSTPATRFRHFMSETISETTKQNMLHLPTMESTKCYTLMAQLPSFRFAEAEKQYPFLNVGLDFFGPFFIEHRNRKLEETICMSFPLSCY